MMKIEFNDVKIKVPQSWQEIKLSDYESWYLQKTDTKADYVRYVAGICGIDPDILFQSPTQVFNILTDAVQFVFKTNFEPSNKIKIGQKDYFISFSEKLTLGEWVDVEAVLSSDSNRKLSDMLAILCRPVGEKYNPELLEERRKLFREQSCDKIMPLIGFFLLRKKKSEAILNHYSTVVDQLGQFLKDTETFVQNGDGIKQLPIWQRIKYIYLMKLLKKQLSKFSGFSFTE